MRLLRPITLTIIILCGWLGSHWDIRPAYSEGVTFTVNSDADTFDGECNAANCTLREAISAANQNPGRDTIAFAIVAQGVPTIHVGSTGLGQLPVITDPVIISGTTQAASRVELNGTNAGQESHGLNITAGNSIIRGLVINRFSGVGILITSAGNNTIESSYIGTDSTGMTDLGNLIAGILIASSSDNRIGGETPSLRNVISGNGDNRLPAPGIAIGGPSTDRTLILGNYIGTNAVGMGDLGNQGEGIRIDDDSDTMIGGTATGAGNVISGNDGSGINLWAIHGPIKSRIEGNLIGTNASGLGALGNGRYGIECAGDLDVIIGGIEANTRNIISGNGSHGISVAGKGVTIQGNFIGVNQTGSGVLPNNGQGISVVDSVGITIGGTSINARNVIASNIQDGISISRSNGVTVEGNYIGVNSGGSGALGNGRAGINIIQSSGSTIGGRLADAGNVIANNAQHGVVVRESGTSNSIRANSIYGNGALGIDLGGDGVTINDPLDIDVEVNNFINFPILYQAFPGDGGTVVRGILLNRPYNYFYIDFYSSPSCDASGFGEGQTYLGYVLVDPFSNSPVNFTTNLMSLIPFRHFITATITDLANNTSEFSRCLDMYEILALITISGKVDMQGRGDDSLVRVEAGEQFVLTRPDGTFSMTLPWREYTIKASHPGYLPAQRPLNANSTFVILPTVTLLGGDTNNDRTINLADLLLIGANYGLAAPPADSRGDINGDGAIGLVDLTLVAANYGRDGIQPWLANPMKEKTATPPDQERSKTARPMVDIEMPNTVMAGQEFEARLVLKGGQDLAGLDIGLAFDPQTLEALGAAEPGDWFTADRGFIAMNKVDSQAGQVRYVATRLGAEGTHKARSVLLTVRFRATHTGRPALTLSQWSYVTSAGDVLTPLRP